MRRGRDRDGVLVAIALFKFAKALVLVAAAFGALELLSPSRAAALEEWVLALAWHLDRRAVPALLSGMNRLTGTRIVLFGTAAFLYAGLFVTEGIGLWNGRRWAEYLTIVATASLIPFECYELIHRTTWPRALTVTINLLVVGYLIWKVKPKTP